MKFVKVALDLPVFKFYTYKSLQDGDVDPVPGMRVLVPVRNKLMTGMIVDSSDQPPRDTGEEDLKSIEDILDDSPLIPGPLLELLLWASEFYVYPPGQVIFSTVPAGLKVSTSSYVYPGERFEELRYLDEALYELLKETKKVKFARLIREGYSYYRISTLINRGFLGREEIRKRERNKVSFYRLLGDRVDGAPSGLVEKRIVEFLRNRDWVSYRELRRNVKSVGRKHLEKLVAKGILEEKVDFHYDSLLWRNGGEGTPVIDLSPFQKRALDEIRGAFSSGMHVLLRGYTGSGKTVIYAELIREILDQGRSAILLVPEISLTPQMVNFFTSLFGDRVAVLHSGLTESERFSEYMAIRNGEKRLIIGVRSAVFAPVRNLGLIIVDEEHEGTYKQEDGFIYHARSVAYKRAEIEHAGLLLGSATPSMESYSAARKGRLYLVELKERFGNSQLPVTRVVDMRGEQLHLSLFSSVMIEEIRDRLKKREQSLLFLNRRGFAPTMICKDCGHVVKCPNCDVPLVFHRSMDKLVCHYCDYKMDVPVSCPSCGSYNLKELGSGTERVEESVKLLFPEAKVERLDRDTMTSRRKYEEIIRRMERGEIDILIGTQMITKGLHFRKVTLSGILLADQTLFMPDFRAVERTYQLITQITGRSGRDSPGGTAVVQTFNPDHYVFEFLGEEHYEEFYEREIEMRRLGRYPPFARLLLFLLSAPTERDAEIYANTLAGRLRQIREEEDLQFQIVGPGPNPIFFLKKRYRYNILLKAPLYKPLQRVGRLIFEEKDRLFPRTVKVKISLDPYSFI